MPKVEVDETEFLANKNLAGVVQAMLANPKSRSLVLEAQKIVKPDTVIPEIDAKAELQAKIDEANARTAALAKQIEDDKTAREAAAKTAAFKQTWDEKKAALRQEGYLDKAIEEIEKLAEQRGIPDLEAAAALYTKQHPPETVVQPSGYGSWNFLEPAADQADDLKVLLETRGESEAVTNRMIGKALDEVRGVPMRRAA